MTSSGISRATGRGRPSRICRKASLTRLPVLCRMVDPRRPFGQRSQDPELVGDLVQQAKASADQVGRDLAADAQDRGVGGVSRGECGCGVEQPRPRHDGIGPGLAARPGIAVSHVGGALLVTRVDDPKRFAGVVERDEQRIVLHAGQRKHRVDAVAAQHLDQRPASRHPRHRVSFSSAFVIPAKAGI